MARKLLILASREPIPDRLLANGRTNPGPPEDPRENRGRGGLWKVPPPWEPELLSKVVFRRMIQAAA